MTMMRMLGVGALLVTLAGSVQAQGSGSGTGSDFTGPGGGGGGTSGGLGIGVPTPQGGSGTGGGGTGGGATTTPLPPSSVGNAIGTVTGTGVVPVPPNVFITVIIVSSGGGSFSVQVPGSSVNNLVQTVTQGQGGGLIVDLRNFAPPSDDDAVATRGPSAPAELRQDPAATLGNALATFADGVTLDELKAATAAYNAYVTAAFNGRSGATLPPITYAIRKTLENLSVYATK
jgi:hypothetical protein